MEGKVFSSITQQSPTENLGAQLKSGAKELYFLQHALKDVQQGLDWGTTTGNSVERNRVRAGTESSTLQLKYPQLSALPMFPALYRFLRAEELNGAFKRGGNILLVGSGTTVYEAAAMAVSAPSKTDVEETFSDGGKKINDYVKNRNLALNGDIPIVLPELLPHQITAVEPDKRQTEGFRTANDRFFGTHTAINNHPLQDVRGELAGIEFDNVLVNRLDPRIFQDDPRLLEFLMGLVKPGGGLVLTIGTGNNEGERVSRRKFIEDAVGSFEQNGFSYTSRIPQEMKDRNKTFFGPDLIGAAIGRKNAS